MAGVFAALDYEARGDAGAPFEGFNLGNSHPVKLAELIELLERVKNVSVKLGISCRCCLSVRSSQNGSDRHAASSPLEAAERAEWISLYRSSGLPQEQFAPQHGLKLGTLQRWLRQERQQSSPSNEASTFQDPHRGAETAAAGVLSP